MWRRGTGVLLLGMAACRSQPSPPATPTAAEVGTALVTGAEARRLVAAGALLLDVRTPAEYAVEHVPGAVNLPVQELASRIGEVPDDRPVVVYCLHGHRAAQAAGMLRTAGRQQVHDVSTMERYRE